MFTVYLLIVLRKQEVGRSRGVMGCVTMFHMLMCICVFNEVYACVCRCLFVPDPEEFSSLSLGGMYACICSSAFISVCFLNVYEKDGAREGVTS